uniref:Uncharacterized protein n=1 Tax=Astyanax mexicanus TaxID=7994 RepID=A0A8B9KLC8_ASTMX
VHHHQHREEIIVADVVAARLGRVTHKVFLLVPPHLLRRNHEHHDPEKEDDREPHTTEGSGVLVDPAQEALEEGPVHISNGCWNTLAEKSGILDLLVSVL